MNQLFAIMRRWLWRDKKRTFLTLASVTLAVFLISFAGVYMSAVLNAYAGSVSYLAPYHARFVLEDLDQAAVLDRNAAWESHAVSVAEREINHYDSAEDTYWGTYSGSARSGSFVTRSLVREFCDTKRTGFPEAEINGISLYTGNNTGLSAEFRGGDPELFPKRETNGRTVSVEPHEVVVSRNVARKYGLEKGGSFELKVFERGGRLFYGTEDEETADLPASNKTVNGRLIAEYKKDAEGNTLYTEDTDGRVREELYQKLNKVCDSEGAYLDSLLSDIYSPDNDKEGLYLINIGEVLPPMYVEFEGEPSVLYEYTATVRDVIDSNSYDLIFSAEDKEILGLMGGSDDIDITYRVRVKEGLDVKDAVISAMKGLGIYDEYTENYYLNVSLLLTEGRQLEYIENGVAFFVVFVIVMALFMFLARLIINNAFEISAAYRTEQYGALKTIGASDKQIFVMIMIESAMYMAAALPAGMGLAVATGRALLSKVRDIGVFDPIYGEGVSEMFFKPELSPYVMWVTFGCALFSVFFSAYAAAVRIKSMPPIMAVGHSAGGRRIKGRSPWLSRRLFGYPFGFAVKCISKQKLRFAVTLLAAVISGIFIMSMGTIADYYARQTSDSKTYTDRRADIIIADYDNFSGAADQLRALRGLYASVNESGLFEEIVPGCKGLLYIDGGSVDSVLTEDYQKLCRETSTLKSGELLLSVYVIPRENYDRYIRSDLSYDEFAASGKALLCRNALCYLEEDESPPSEGYTVVREYRDRNDSMIGITDIDMLPPGDIGELDIKGSARNKSDGETVLVPVDLPVIGAYTTDCPDYMAPAGDLAAILPLDGDLSYLMPGDNGADGETFRFNDSLGFDLYVEDEKLSQANSFIDELCRAEIEKGGGLFLYSFIEDDSFEQKGLDAIRIAGLGFASALAAVVLLNIFSTMSANMINRRRDLSMMRSCGMSMAQVMASLVIESGFYAVITAAVSSVLGWLLAGSILSLAEVSPPTFSQLLSRSRFPFAGALGLFDIIMIVNAAAYVPALISISRSNIAEEIRTKL